MAIDIENPGADEAALKAALGNLVGMALIDSGTISSPVEYLDLDLPSGYELFILRFINVMFDTADIMAFGFSADAGATFFENAAAYKHELIHATGNTAMDNVPYSDVIGSLQSANLTITNPELNAADFEIVIRPGSASRSATLFSRCRYNSSATEASLVEASVVMTQESARVNLIRFFPYGDGVADPPTSEETITSGSYFLYGVPTP